MKKRLSGKLEPSSVELSMSNGIINNQSNWSRCNSFSSSSSDSTLYCSNSNFSGRKRLKNDEPMGKIVKRSRNSSGSSASSNVSCMSDKDINRMPALMSPEQVSREINSIETLNDVPPSTFQHETLLNSRLSHPLDMSVVLPFRHNLRRNIRRKTCSCDCTATCTTVVVSRQYKGIGEQTVEEKTVISRTKVKTYVDSNNAQTPIRQVEMSSKVSFQENLTQESVAHKNDCSRKRRSELDRLYESLHEIKWAKNFSPDNILRQFDVRQAASCSAFGKMSEEKYAKSNNKANKCSKDQIYAKSPNETPGKIKISRRYNKSYTTRSRIRSSSRNFVNKLEEEESNPPLLEKSIITNDDSINIDLPNTYPVLSKEVSTPEKGVSENNADFSTTCDTKAICRNFSENILSFEVNSQHDIDNENIEDCSSTFFDIADDNIDACFREVGAEVVVSTSCDNDLNSLPLLTAIKEIHTSNIKPVSPDCPPVLEQCETSFSFSYNNTLIDFDNTTDVKSSWHNEPIKKFFPPVNSLLISDEDYFQTLPFLDDCKNNSSCNENDKCRKIIPIEANVEKINVVQSFHDINEGIVDNVLKTNPNLSNLVSVSETKDIIEPEPPVLEPCISNKVSYINIKSQISIIENIKNKDTDVNEPTNNSLSNICDKENFIINKTNNFSLKSKNVNQICKSTKKSLNSKSLSISLGGRILKKYIRFIHSKSKSRSRLYKICNKSLKSSTDSQKASIINSFCNRENVLTNDNSSVIPLSVIKCAQLSPVKVMKPLLFPSLSPSQISETIVNKKCISSSESCLKSTSTVIQSFNQKLSFSTSQENIVRNQINSSSVLAQTDEKPCFNNNNNKKAKKSSHNIFNNHYSENFADIPGYTKILLAAKKKEGPTDEKVKVPPRVFTCHFQTINVTRDNDYIQIVLKITRGKSIFLTHETLVELKEAINKAGNDKDCKQLILNGFGQTFCLGLDVRPLVGDRKNEIVGDIANAVKDLIGALADFQKPLLAIVNGAAYGLGLTILNHADVTLATNNASFCMPYSRLGYMPEGGATLTLPQAVGTTVATDLILRGQVITAEQARDIGLVNEVVQVRHLPQELVSRVKALAQNSLTSTEATKAMLKMRLHIQLPLVLETEVKLLPQMWLSSSCQEAIQSVLDSGFFEDC